LAFIRRALELELAAEVVLDEAIRGEVLVRLGRDAALTGLQPLLFLLARLDIALRASEQPVPEACHSANIPHWPRGKQAEIRRFAAHTDGCRAHARGQDCAVVLNSTYLKRALALLVTGISLYLLLPSLAAVFSSAGSLRHLEWPWVVVAAVFEAASFVAIWELNRIALRTRDWFAVACSQLAGNAVGRIVPGGGATATAFSVSMLRRAGVDSGEAAAGLSASAILQIATTLALPLLAVPAIVGGAPIAHGLATAAYLGFGVVVLLLLVAAAPLRPIRRCASPGTRRSECSMRPSAGAGPSRVSPTS
jgi:hypothetical protein